MVTRVLTRVELNGTDVTSSLASAPFGWKTTDTFGEAIGKADVNLRSSVTGTISPTPGNTLEIWRGTSTATDEKIFSGNIDKIGLEGPIIKLMCFDKLAEATRRVVTTIFDSSGAQAGVVSDIFTNLLSTYTDNLSTSTDSIQSSSAEPTLFKFVCNKDDVFERLVTLRDVLGWQFYYRADSDLVYFEPVGFVAASTNLTVGQNVQGIPKWNEDKTRLLNDLEVWGATQLVSKTENFTGDGSTATYTLARIPTAVEVVVDSVQQEGGEPGVSASFDYYVNASEREVVFDSGSIPSNGAAIVVNYDNRIPIPIVGEDAASIGSYGKSSKIYTFPDLEKKEDAIEKWRSLLDKYSTPFLSTTLNAVGITDFRPGQKLTVNDSFNAKTEDVTVNQIVKQFPHRFDVVSVGDENWRTAQTEVEILKKIKELNDFITKNQDVVQKVIRFQPDAMSVFRRQFTISSQNLSTSFVWRDSTLSDSNSQWGVSTWGDRRETATDIYDVTY